MRAKVQMCPMPGCWRESARIKGGMCTACLSWWHRISIYSPRELAAYLQRLGRFSGRFSHMRNSRAGFVLLRGGRSR